MLQKSQSEINVINRINLSIKSLNQNQYTLSLLKQGLRTGRISNREAEHFQLQIMDILKDLIMRYTKGESTSVKVDTAENIINSVLYSIDAGLKSQKEIEVAIEAIKEGLAKQMYDTGLAKVAACFKESQNLYLNLRKKRLKVELEAYDCTIEEALPAFFAKYGIVFDAHNTMASIDYPLLFDDMSVKGIFYIRNYLRTLTLENDFCRCFPEEEIKKILITFGQIYKIDYRKTLTNIFELILNGSFFSVLSDGIVNELLLSSFQYEVLQRKLRGISLRELELIIDKTINKVLIDLNISNCNLIEYIYRYKPLLKTRLLTSLEVKSLEKLVLFQDEMSTPEVETIFIEGERMTNQDFRRVVKNVMEAKEPMSKIGIIRSEIHSLEDFIDMLEAEALFGDEYGLLFSELSCLELGLLTKVIFADEMRDGLINLVKIMSFRIDADVEWHEYFIEYLKTIDTDKLRTIEDNVNEIKQ